MEQILLEIPAMPENMLVARLTVSGVCTRLGFAVDALEDAKVAVAEACLMLMQRPGCASLRILLEKTQNGLRAVVQAQGEGDPLPVDEEYDEEYSTLMLGALTDELSIAARRIELTISGEI